MKKMILALGAALAMLAFSACNKQNTTTVQPEPEPETRVATITYDFTVTDDLFSLADFTIDYVDADGTVKLAALTEAHMLVRFDTETPGTYGFVIHMAPKENYADLLEAGKVYTIGHTNASGISIDGDWSSSGSKSTVSVKAEDMETYFASYADRDFCSHKIEFPEE